MSDPSALPPRISALPWSLNQIRSVSGAAGTRERDGFYVGMLNDDLSNQHYAYEISFVPEGIEINRASAIILALLNDFNHLGNDRDPAPVVCDFARGLLSESVHHEDMVLELHALPDEYNRGTSRARRWRSREAPADGSVHDGRELPCLGFIPGWSASRRGSDLSQVASELGHPDVVIPGTRIKRFGLHVEEKERWKRSVRDLRSVDKLKRLENNFDRFSWRGYSFSEHIATQYRSVATATAPIGWDGRGLFSESFTSPYLAFRRLRFIRFWSEAVETSVEFLNQFTDSALLFGEERFTFALDGLPSPRDLTDAMGSIQSGSLTVEEAHNKYVFPKYARGTSGQSEKS